MNDYNLNIAYGDDAGFGIIEVNRGDTKSRKRVRRGLTAPSFFLINYILMEVFFMKNKKFNTQAEDVIEVEVEKEDDTMNKNVEEVQAQETEEKDTKPAKKHKIRNAVKNGAVKFIGFTQKHPILVTAGTALVSGAVSAFVAYKFGVHVGEDGFLDKWAEDLAKDVKDSGVKDIVGMTKDGVITDLHNICGSDKIYDAVIAAAQIINPAEGTGIHIGRHDDVIEVTSTFWEAVADKIADNATDASDISDTTEAVQEILDSVTEL